jgi:hypothetical protein
MTQAKATPKKATPKADPKQPASTPPETGATEDPIPALLIRSAAGSVRCCGHRFHPEPYGIALSALTDEEVDILQNDPRLVVEEVLGQ